MGCGSSSDASKKPVGKALVIPADAKPEVVFVLGGPGAGKGTQCAKIVEEYGFVHLSAGDLLREERKTESKNAELINTYIKEGKIVPVAITVALLRQAMEKHGKESGKKHFLIDGFPRNKDNLDGWFKDMSDFASVAFCLFFDCPEKTMEERLLERGKTSGRDDDNIESIKKRFRTYLDDTMPVVNHFDSIGKCKKVSAVPPPSEVFAAVKAIFDAEIEARHISAEHETTFAFIKPDAYPNKDKIIDKIKENGFTVVASRDLQLTKEQAEEFYAEHKGKGFFNDLVGFMTSGTVTALALRKPGAIKAWRALLGPTNSLKAKEEAPQSLRALFGTDGQKNACHGSDSIESAKRELGLLFPGQHFYGEQDEKKAPEETTFAFIKPDAYANKDPILEKIKAAGFTVVATRDLQLTKEQAEEFYAEHKGKGFFNDLVGFMTSGTVTALALRKQDAIKAWRALLGPTNSLKAKEEAPQSLRALFGTDGQKNACHGSDSIESAKRELGLLFPDQKFY